MIKRIEQRVAFDPTDFGATAEEMDLILELCTTQKDIPQGGVIIDSTQELDVIVKDILRYCKR